MNSAVYALARRFALGAAVATVGLALSGNTRCYGQANQQQSESPRTSQAASQVNVPQPNWIWAPIKREPNRAAGICYFRKTFVLRSKGRGHLKIACDDQFTVYVNGVKVASGSGWEQMKRYEIGPYLRRGRNVVAIESVKSEPGPAGLAATISLIGPKNEEFHMATNETWKTSLEKKSSWQHAGFIENGWLAAHVIASTTGQSPWRRQTRIAKNSRNPAASNVTTNRGGGAAADSSRFKVAREFRVEWVVRPEDSGSLIAMSFDEFGNIIASRERGPLLLIRDVDKDGIPERVTTYCQEVENCQGILAMNGRVMVTADGPDGSGLYELFDEDRDGVIDQIKRIVSFKGRMHEHGPHGLRLGPDGMIYLIAGNLSQIDADVQPTSPYRHFYEGDLVQPKYNDPRGHANGVKAPGGVIYRIDPTGQHIERFAGGLRNAYDIAFNASGDLFTWDADMEWDLGTSWYRPTRLNHVVSGGEYGWRSGWSKWPRYYLDSLPAIEETGSGSPTGVVVYDHFMFPVRYHGALFVGDWSQGQILAIKMKRQGATYVTESSVFIDGNPLNVTDLEVGPDGLLYFCTGGRGTEGGVYRVTWTGTVPPSVTELGDGLEAALRQPQLQTAWSRQRIALIKRDMGDRWDEEMLKTVRDASAPTPRRTRALHLMQLFGPQPSTELLVKLSKDRDGQVRNKAAYFLGIHADGAALQRLGDMVGDPDVVVQRTACESLVRTGSGDLPVEKLVKLLGHQDRFLSWAAAKALQNLPLSEWKTQVFDSDDQRTLLVGSAAILGTRPNQDTCREILSQLQELSQGFVADREFVDLLRVIQLALRQGDIAADNVPNLRRQIAKEFPAGNATINRELVRILAHMESPLVAERYLDHLKTDLEIEDKTHLVAHAPHFVGGWSSNQRFEMLKLMADVRNLAGSPSHARYMDDVAQRFVGQLSADEQLVVLDQGAKWPGAAIGALAKLPELPDDKALEKLKELDQVLVERDSESANRLRIGIAAVLARSGNDGALAYLRNSYENEPERRGILSVALAQHPNSENWPLLIRSLPILEGGMAVEVLTKLAEARRVSEDPEALRQVILQGLKQKHDTGRRLAIKLLEKWSQKSLGSDDDTPQQTIAAWQAWYTNEFPQLPAAVLPKQADADRYKLADLQQYLFSDEALAANMEHGKLVFTKAQCIKCHRYGDVGEGIGPDLTTISKRFQKKELLESILFPSHVIPDQYATRTIVTTDGRIHTGVVHERADGSVTVLDSEGKQIEVASEDIDEITRNNQSTMPSGLLNSLSLQEIADLFAYLNQAPVTSVSQRPRP